MAASTAPITALEILLIGRTGNGKSSSGNSILGQELFVTSDSSQSETSETSVKFVKRNNYNIQVVDTPGVCDTKFANDIKKNVEYTVEKLSDSFYHCRKGFHALALVLKYGSRMTAEEIEAVNQLRKIFGEDFIKNHCIIIVTGGENFDINKKNASFKNWCEKQEGFFSYLLAECQDRIVLFYNLSAGEKKQTEAVDQFLSLVANIGNRYTNDEFKKWKSSRDALIVRSGLVQLKENIQPKIDIVVNKLIEIKDFSTSIEDMLYKLKMLKAEVDDLKTEIDNEDRDTEVLVSLKTPVKNLDQSINRTIETLKKAQQDGHSLDTMREYNETIQMMLVHFKQLAVVQELGKLHLEKARIEARNNGNTCIIS